MSTLDLPEGVGAVVEHYAHRRFTRSTSPRRQDRVREPLMHSHRVLLRRGRGQERFRPQTFHVKQPLAPRPRGCDRAVELPVDHTPDGVSIVVEQS